jgi:anti-sigma factor RsiW
MSCSPFDLRDYFFGELPEEERRQVDLHTKGCAVCREELNTLRSTQAILLSVPDEEIPQRIGFVSDRVYEPSRLMRWWRAFWGSAPRLGFASAAMLSVAIIVSAMHRPASVTPVTVDVARLQADFSRELNQAVEKAVAESDARHQRRTAELLAAATKRFETQRRAEMAADFQSLAIADKYARLERRAAMFPEGSR